MNERLKDTPGVYRSALAEVAYYLVANGGFAGTTPLYDLRRAQLVVVADNTSLNWGKGPGLPVSTSDTRSLTTGDLNTPGQPRRFLHSDNAAHTRRSCCSCSESFSGSRKPGIQKEIIRKVGRQENLWLFRFLRSCFPDSCFLYPARQLRKSCRD